MPTCGVEGDMIDEQANYGERPVPIIDPEHCNGCGLCMRVCPTGTLALQHGKVVVARPAACEYTGLCELICPTQAIQRPFVIVLADNNHETRANQAAQQKHTVKEY
jgi:NAD-dependent dihydropyrimidine dehydrogenase PreA subunit